MSPRKLTAEDKQEILQLYRETEATTSTLASQFEVSSSTISRFLKNSLSTSEYEDLIQQKRIGRNNHRPQNASPEKVPVKINLAPVISSVIRQSEPEPEIKIEVKEDSDFDDEITDEGERTAIEEMFGEDISDLDEDEEEDDDDDWEEEITIESLTPRDEMVEVLPLSEASLPKVCYLVIDKYAELITRPLKEFADLGVIPSEETQQKTLPIFENHKVARRFSNRSQRVIKIPDSLMLKKVGSYLQGKGITRLLIDGHIYRVLPSS